MLMGHEAEHVGRGADRLLQACTQGGAVGVGDPSGELVVACMPSHPVQAAAARRVLHALTS